ncbi:CHASE2 domain-containing protein [Bosea sp. BIWAKO-01]|uniref:CHASE2 domain-containing protein n=1 Tax=Bosea sp. BIWAKO-01 TaxID=506668 RepID=UPI00086BB51E|nr:adenylate/guanylate cyclase domain-containing protein [Bosea sp. BIWAKO-01]GAU81439.1 adenylate cyclase [Bosea sp. BIWAKO-01]
MTSTRSVRLPASITILCFVIAALWSGFLGRMHLAGERNPLDRVEAALADMRLLIAGRRSPPGEIVIIAIDDETVAQQRGYPLQRSTLARMILAIGTAAPRTLALDLLLVDPTSPEADEALAQALQRTPSLVAAAGSFDRDEEGSSQIPAPKQMLWPLSPFDPFAAVGLVNISSDASGTPRHVPLLFRTDRGVMPSFVLSAAAGFKGEAPVFGVDTVRVAGSPVKLDLGFHLPLRFYGPRGSFETISATRLLAGTVPAERLRGRIVIVGVTATAIGDTFSTAFDPVTPGVEVLATGIAHLIAGTGLVRDHEVRLLDAGVALVLATGSVLLIASAPLGIGVGVVVFGLAAWLLATTALFAAGYWLSSALPLASVIPPVVLAMVFRQTWDRRQATDIARSEAALRQFQPPLLADRIARDPEFLREPVQQTVAILFVDLSGFTRLSEQAGLTRTREFLKAFHTLIENEVTAHDGLVISFMGDGAMIAFGIPDPHADDAGRALSTAWALLRDMQEWATGEEVSIGHPDLRVGVHFGPVIVSRLGHEAHQHITATGDSVNVASRLMEIAKEQGAALAVSAELLVASGDIRKRHREPDSIRTVEIRGRRQRISVALWGV